MQWNWINISLRLKRQLLLLFLVFQLHALHAQNYIVSEQFLKTYTHIINFRKTEAQRLIQLEKKSTNQNLLFVLLESQLYFTEAFITETTLSKQLWENKFLYWEKELSSGKKNSPFFNYCLAHLYLQRGLLGLKHQNYIHAGIDIRKASKLLEENYMKFPDFVVQYKELGMLNCFIGNIPEQFIWLTKLAGINGDIVTGEKRLLEILKLSFSTKEYAFLQLETLLYYSAFVTMLTNDQERSEDVLRYFTLVRQEYQNSPVYLYVCANIYSHLGKNDKALQVVSAYNPTETDIPFVYLDYLRGLYLLQKGSPHAKKFFLRFAGNFKGIHNIRSAYHKLAWCWLIEENYDQYNLYISIAKNSGVAVNDADKQALAEAIKCKTPHPVLLKSRLLSDGGYYEKALDELSTLDSVKICEHHIYCVEYHYRKARILHLKNNVHESVDLYKKVIEMGRQDTEYFAANSALILASMYEDKNDITNAKYYYSMCLTLPFEEYRNSIQQKAKAGLNRL